MIAVSLLFLFTGCAGFELHQEAWDNLPERKFYFTEFKYIHTGKDTQYALDTMKEFPLKKLMYILSRNYNIEIDMSDFYAFLNNNRKSEIKTHGFFRESSFTWSSGKNYTNRIQIKFERDYMDESKMKATLKATADGKNLKTVDMDFTRFEILFNKLKYYFSDTEKFLAEFVNNGYNDAEKVPGLILGTASTIQIAEKSKKEQIKSLLDEYVKNLDEEQKKIFKHEIIDHIYKICE